jgi:hypothetical protein
MNEWEQILEEVASLPPDTYRVKGRISVTVHSARYAAGRLRKALRAWRASDDAVQQEKASRMYAWVSADVEEHHNVPDEQGNPTTVRVKLDTWTAYIKVEPPAAFDDEETYKDLMVGDQVRKSKR